MSQFKLAATLKCSVKEAEKLIDDYFKQFPQIKRTLAQFGRFGVQNGYTQTLSPFFRKRWFPTWEFYKSSVDIHLSGVEHNTALGRIERQSKNHPIQGSGADIIKLAMWLTYKYIRDNKLTDKVHILLNVHDQLTTACTEDLGEWWKDKLDELMCQAAKKVIPSGLLKAETNISTVWTK
jgi:DNA polymerase-1